MSATEKERSVSPPPAKREEVVWGKTPSGQVFRVPTTHGSLVLFNPNHPKSHVDLVNLALLGGQLLLFAWLPRAHARIFFLLYFAFWRAAYDAGLGWVLTRQSKRKWIVKEVQRRGWLDQERRPQVRSWIKEQLRGKMGKDYSFDDLPLEYNTWLLFRQAVDIILLNDFVAYCLFAFACFRVPTELSFFVHVCRWLGGIALIAFNLWVKTEAHNVVKDYGWYWGDVFFQRGALVFDGVFELAPHPMYSVGYAGYYGLSLIVGSYPVLFVSLAAHAAQFAFLVFFENPHIERMYGQRKLLAQRTPIPSAFTTPTASTRRERSASTDTPPTPASTEADTASSTDLETETETEFESAPRMVKPPKKSPPSASASTASLTAISTTSSSKKSARLPVHDMLNLYFRKDALIFHNVDLFRASDLQLVLLLVYTLIMALLPNDLSRSATLVLYGAHALFWTLVHTFGLGHVLRAQGERKFLVRHFLKNYHYTPGDGGTGAVREAFANWKRTYNTSMCMSYVSFMALAWKTYSIPKDWTVGSELLRHTLGVVLLGLHVWATMESYEVLGVFGWFFGDFFIDDFPASLEYTGIYRYLNNPEIMSGAAFFGLAMISGSKLVFALAVVRHLSHWWFLSQVEYPHMRKLYGDSLRNEAGFVKVIRKVATRNARLLESRAGKHAPAIRSVAKEFIGTFDKVYMETAEVVEDFLAKSKPRLSGVVQDTKVLLQQSRERLIITRVASNLSSFDATKYKISIVPPVAGGPLRFHLGEPIHALWQAPVQHSRRDWIGLYRIGVNQSKLVTKVASKGMWVPVHDDEWEGDVPVKPHPRKASPVRESESEQGKVLFTGGTLPWQVGRYEIRYHHDGKYNVMSMDGPIEVYVDEIDTLDFESVRTYLLRIVTLCLDSDPSLVPQAARTPTSEDAGDDAERDGDDFRFWSERQARRIAGAILQAFDVELAAEVVMADANVSALANRILASKEILGSVGK